jgi:ketosteroid isomerase-like protein
MTASGSAATGIVHRSIRRVPPKTALRDVYQSAVTDQQHPADGRHDSPSMSPARNGEPYCNQYCMVFTLRDGRIRNGAQGKAAVVTGVVAQ